MSLKYVTCTVKLEPTGLEPDRNIRFPKDPRAVLEHVPKLLRVGQQPLPQLPVGKSQVHVITDEWKTQSR